MQISRMGLGVIGLVLVSACETTMNENDCATADWGEIGYADGLAGRSMERLNERALQCGKFGIIPDEVSYRSARNEALNFFCTVQSGIDHGSTGADYEGVCPVELEPAFLAGYERGLDFYGYKSAYDSAKSDYDNHVDGIESARRRLRAAQRKIQDPDLDPEAVEKQRKRINRARKDIDYHRDQLPYAEDKLYNAEKAFDGARFRRDSFTPIDGNKSFWELQFVKAALDFANKNEAVAACHDYGPGRLIRCFLRPAMEIRDDRTGEICALGPGVATVYSQGDVGPRDAYTGYHQQFNYYTDINYQEDIPALSGFQVFYEGRDRPLYAGVSCVDPSPRGPR